MAIPVAGRELDPFDALQVNAALTGSGLVYGAGIGRFHASTAPSRHWSRRPGTASERNAIRGRDIADGLTYRH